MKLLIHIWMNEYKRIFSDSGAIMLFLIAIAIYPIIYALAYNNEQAKEVPIAMVDENQSALSRQAIRMIDATDEVRVAYKFSNLERAEQFFGEGKVFGLMVIPKDFERSILKSEPTHIAVYADASYMILYKQVVSSATYAMGTMGAGIEIKREIAKGQNTELAFSERDPLPIEPYALFNPKGGYATYAMPAVLLLILQQTLLLGIGLLGGTIKEKGGSHFLLETGLKRGGTIPIVLGKGLAYFSIYILNTVFVLVVVFRLFGFPMRSDYFSVFIFVIPFLWAVIFMGMAISALFKHRESSMMILLFTSIPFVFLSGFSWPKLAMPLWLQWLSELIPSSPAIHGFLALSQKGAPFSDVMPQWHHLWILCIVFFLAALGLLKLQLIKVSRKSDLES